MQLHLLPKPGGKASLVVTNSGLAGPAMVEGRRTQWRAAPEALAALYSPAETRPRRPADGSRHRGSRRFKGREEGDLPGPATPRYTQSFPHDGRSSNGRTHGSEPWYRGSNPCLPATYPLLRFQLTLAAFLRLQNVSTFGVD